MTHEKRLVVRIDPEFLEAVKAKAKAEDLTVSQLVRRLLRKWLGEDPPEPEKEG
jgi:predicted DNA binding CopG/RHH family protein